VANLLERKRGFLETRTKLALSHIRILYERVQFILGWQIFRGRLIWTYFTYVGLLRKT